MIEQRLSVEREARRWLGTPHVHRQRCIGAGIDCALFIMEAFAGAGLIERFDPGHYTADWHWHKNEEIYLGHVESRMHLISETDTTMEERLSQNQSFCMDRADVVMMRVGRTYSHGVIVTDWPHIIHAYFPSGMVEETIILGTPMMRVPTRLYSFWGATA